MTRSIDKHGFMECDTCRAKPGTPTLCSGCFQNRERIAELSANLQWESKAQRRREQWRDFQFGCIGACIATIIISVVKLITLVL